MASLLGSILRVVGPKWKHGTARERRAAALVIEDQDILAEIARTDTDVEVRLSALGRLRDVALLMDLAGAGDLETGSSAYRRVLALSEDPLVLAAIARSQKSHADIRLRAVAQINSEEILAELACEPVDTLGSAVVRQALSQIRSPSLRARLAKLPSEGHSYETGSLQFMPDKGTEEERNWGRGEWEDTRAYHDLREEALEGIEDADALGDIACNAVAIKICELAAARYVAACERRASPGWAALRAMWVSPDSETFSRGIEEAENREIALCIAALAPTKLSAFGPLLPLVKDRPAERLVMGRLASGHQWGQIGLLQESSRPEARLVAVLHREDQAWLATMALWDADPVVRVQAAKRMHDRKFLEQVRARCDDEEVRRIVDSRLQGGGSI